ncbi:MAG: histidine phosphatase family protein [Rhodospirillaceae bacterium]|nr:histidine phosphatase family protein [Rhodospirillaceae bacterium]
MLKSVPFYFIRHGETEWNKLRLMQGQTDVPLNAAGIVQAHAAGKSLAALDIKTICASPLRRARYTAEIIAKYIDAPIVDIVGLMECNFGIYEGHPSDSSWHTDWIKGATIPGGETLAEFRDRTLTAINHALDHAGPVLIVAHGGNFLSIRDAVLDATTGPAGNCAPMVFSPQGGSWALEAVMASATKHK